MSAIRSNKHVLVYDVKDSKSGLFLLLLLLFDPFFILSFFFPFYYFVLLFVAFFCAIQDAPAVDIHPLVLFSTFFSFLLCLAPSGFTGLVGFFEKERSTLLPLLAAIYHDGTNGKIKHSVTTSDSIVETRPMAPCASSCSWCSFSRVYSLQSSLSFSSSFETRRRRRIGSDSSVWYTWRLPATRPTPQHRPRWLVLMQSSRWDDRDQKCPKKKGK